MRFGALEQDDYNLMKKAGFRLLKFGLESANQETLDKLNKGIKIKDIEIEIPAFKRNGDLIPDIKKQKELAKEYEEIYEIKDKLVQYLQGLNEISVEI